MRVLFVKVSVVVIVAVVVILVIATKEVLVAMMQECSAILQ